MRRKEKKKKSGSERKKENPEKVMASPVAPLNSVKTFLMLKVFASMVQLAREVAAEDANASENGNKGADIIQGLPRSYTQRRETGPHLR